MTVVKARSQASRIRSLMEGPVRVGRPLGHGYVDVDGYVLAVGDRPGFRLPNGIDLDRPVTVERTVLIGDGVLRLDDLAIEPGTDRSMAEEPRVTLRAVPRLVPDARLLAGNGAGLTPAGDDILIGYVASLVRYHGDRETAKRVVEVASTRTTGLVRALLQHGVNGELPEAAEPFLQRGDLEPLLRFGRTSGAALAVGLAFGCGIAGPGPVGVLPIEVEGWFPAAAPLPAVILVEIRGIADACDRASRGRLVGATGR